jgi:2-phospho-L-lactate guanylyltransferase
MSVFAVVPVKTLLKSKTRLSIVLSPQERQALTLAMLEDVLRAVKRSIVYQIVVISSDPVVQRFTCNFGVTVLQEKEQGLNKAIMQATQWCVQKDAELVLIILADIPLLKPEDVNEIVNLSSEKICIVISPSRNGGTNALMQKPPNIIPMSFGPNSFRKHLAEASARGVPSRVYLSQRVALDIDSVKDMEYLLRNGKKTASNQLLEKIEMNIRLKF